LNFGIADKYNGTCNLRFDDTNPLKESDEYVKSIITDVEWLGYNVENSILYASDYFDIFYEHAITLIKADKAYVDDQSAELIKQNRGNLSEPGINSPFRNRSTEENLTLFQEMKSGLYANGEKVLRAKIDMSSPNLNMRDPVMYRIIHADHHRTGNQWCIYPMYDWAHGLEDSIEGITHSICTLEFQDHRPLYDWYLNQLQVHHPQQIEFARLDLNYTVMSKRKLKDLVDNQYVDAWDDPRMPTISGLRNRGYSPDSIKLFCSKIGVAKRNNIIDYALLEYCVREDLNKKAMRVMAVLDPIKLIIDNYPDDNSEDLIAENNPENEKDGTRKIPFSKELWIERSDFMEDAPKKYFRLSIGKEVRLKHAYYVTCTKVVKDNNGDVLAVHCNYDPDSKGGWTDDGRKVRGTLHWVSVKHAMNAEVRLYDRLFMAENPLNTKKHPNFTDVINPNSLMTIDNCKIEPSLQTIDVNMYYQFLRTGYFCFNKESSQDQLIFNRTSTLRDSWKTP
jgi:glutaminyl-tRNA synthetase